MDSLSTRNTRYSLSIHSTYSTVGGLMREIKLIDGRCKKIIIDGFFSYQCQRKAAEDGYCKQHNPERVNARKKAREERWQKEWDDNEHRIRIRNKEREALEVVKKIATGVESPLETARQFIHELQEIIDNPKKED